MTVLSPQPKMQFTTAAGVPLSGGKVYTYIAGTTTPQATFTDYTGATPNTNPVILNSRGEANIWLGGALYKFKLTDANDVEIWTVDYISAPTSSVSAVLSGNVSIDSDTPGPALKITQTGTGPVLRVQDSADPDTTPFIIDTDGNLGLGTATPTAQLEATGAAKIGSLTLTSAPLPVASGGTGATTAATARANLGAATTGAVTASGLTMATSRLLGRTTAGSGAIEEITVGTGLSLTGGTLTAPVSSFNGLLLNVQVFTSSGTYTRTTNVTRAVVIAVGGGGGGGGASGSGGTGGTTSFGSQVTAVGGSGGTGGGVSLSNPGGVGGTGGTGSSISVPGQGGGAGSFSGADGVGGIGGGAGGGRGTVKTAGIAGSRGGGGSGASTDGGCSNGRGCGGGGQGETAIDYIATGLGATETVTIGAAGTAGAGTPAGGAGGAGYIIVYEYS